VYFAELIIIVDAMSWGYFAFWVYFCEYMFYIP